MKELNELIGKCVRKNVRFPGTMNTSYTVQNFFDGTMTMNTIREMGNRLNKKLRALSEDDLFGDNTENSKERAMLQLQVDTLVTTYKYKLEMKERAERAAKTRESNKERMAVLKEVIAKKELGELESKRKGTLEKMRAEIEAEMQELES